MNQPRRKLNCYAPGVPYDSKHFTNVNKLKRFVLISALFSISALFGIPHLASCFFILDCLNIDLLCDVILFADQVGFSHLSSN